MSVHNAVLVATVGGVLLMGVGTGVFTRLVPWGSDGRRAVQCVDVHMYVYLC